MSNGFGQLGLGLVMLTRATWKHRRTIAAELAPVLKHILRRAQDLLRWIVKHGLLMWLTAASLCAVLGIAYVVLMALPFIALGLLAIVLGAMLVKALSWLRGNKEVTNAPDRRERESSL